MHGTIPPCFHGVIVKYRDNIYLLPFKVVYLMILQADYEL
jgi:hypothetical protein